MTPKEKRRQKLITIVKEHNLNPYKLAPAMGITVPTFYNWTSGRTNSPPYAVKALCAAIYGAQPATEEETLERWRELGVGQSVASYWRNSGQIPMVARIAVSWMKMETQT